MGAVKEQKYAIYILFYDHYDSKNYQGNEVCNIASFNFH